MGDERRWMRLPEESAQAYAAFRAYLDAGPGQRSIAQAYRQLKGMPDGAPVKVPGYINAWTKQYSWAERAAAWDAHVESLAEITGLAELQAARKQTVDQAAELQGMIQSELREVQRLMDRDQRKPGDPDNQSGRLANLAAALESAARARLMALGGGEVQSE